MFNFRSHNLAEIDEGIVTSRKSKIAQGISQFSGMAVIGIVAEKFKGDPVIISWLSGMALTGISVRLGIERGSTMRRHSARKISQEMDVPEVGFTETERIVGLPAKNRGISGPFLATNLAMWTGMQEQWKEAEGEYYGPWVPEVVSIPVAIAAGAAGIKVSESAGKALDAKPFLHTIAHLK